MNYEVGNNYVFFFMCVYFVIDEVLLFSVQVCSVCSVQLFFSSQLLMASHSVISPLLPAPTWSENDSMVAGNFDNSLILDAVVEGVRNFHLDRDPKPVLHAQLTLSSSLPHTTFLFLSFPETLSFLEISYSPTSRKIKKQF